MCTNAFLPPADSISRESMGQQLSSTRINRADSTSDWDLRENFKQDLCPKKQSNISAEHMF